MVEATWAPSADVDPRAQAEVYPEFDGGYPSFAFANLNGGRQRGSLPNVHTKGHSIGPSTFPHGVEAPTQMRHSISHSHLSVTSRGYPPSILISATTEPASPTSKPSLAFLPPPQPTPAPVYPPSQFPHQHTAAHYPHAAQRPYHANHSHPSLPSQAQPAPHKKQAHPPHPTRSQTLPSTPPASSHAHSQSHLTTPTTTASPASAMTGDTVKAPYTPHAPASRRQSTLDVGELDKPLPITDEPRLLMPQGKPWVHDLSRPHFLPPACTFTPSPLILLHDTLDIARDYREFIETIGRLELEYGRSLQAAVKKFESRLDAVNTPVPGGRKPPATTLTAGMRAHLAEMTTVADLYMKRPNTLNSQLGHPLSKLDRRGGEATRRLGAWSKDIRTRWEDGRHRVDTARTKFDNAVRDHHNAQIKLRQCVPPEQTTSPQVGSEWVKVEKLANELERARSDRKKAYVVAVAGEGVGGGGGRDIAEGGGPGGWGEEARELYGHIQYTMLELLQHHVEEDRAHYALLGNVLSRVTGTYGMVDLSKDQDSFLEWNTRDDDSQITSEISTPGLSASSSATIPDETPTMDSSHPSLQCHEFIAPPWAQDETAVLDTARLEDRNWLVNRWLIASAEHNSLTDGFNKGIAPAKREQLARIRQACLEYSTNRGLGDPEEMWERRMSVLRELGSIERRVVVTRAEMACLEAVLGPNPRPEMTHEFKDRAFATPSPCDACKQNIWSPIKSELACRHCGLALHKHCALHVDPECTGLKSRRRTFSNGGAGRIRRSLTSGALKLRRATMYEAPHGGPQEVRAPSQNSSALRLEPLRDDEAIISPFVVAETEADRIAVLEALEPDVPPVAQLARVRYAYPAEGVLELSVAGGEIVRVIEPDLDGSGWAKVRRDDGANPGAGTGGKPSTDGDVEGLVPLYVLALVGESTAPIDGGCGSFVSATFAFPPPNHTLGRGEVAIARGAMYELTSEGMAFDELWCELLVPAPDGGVRVKGVVPKTYVRAVEL